MAVPSSHVGLSRSRLRTLGTHYHPTLDPAILWTSSNDTSRPVCSDSLNLMSPAPLYLRTLWRYTNAVIIIIIIILLDNPSRLLKLTPHHSNAIELRKPRTATIIYIWLLTLTTGPDKLSRLISRPDEIPTSRSITESE